MEVVSTKASAGKRRHVLIVVQNLPVPFDRRVWLLANGCHMANADQRQRDREHYGGVDHAARPTDWEVVGKDRHGDKFLVGWLWDDLGWFNGVSCRYYRGRLRG